MSTPIEMTTHCPSDETLAAFVDGRLAESERREVIQHVATCEICYDITSATWDYQAIEEPNVVPFPKRRPWIGAAAAVAAALAIVFLTPVREKLFWRGTGELVEVSAGQESPTVARLSGFRHTPKVVTRAVSKDNVTAGALAEALYIQIANERKSSVRALHALGVAQLFDKDRRGAAADTLTRAIQRDTNINDLAKAIQASSNAKLLNDLAVALYTNAKYQEALAAAERSWQIEKSQEAGWNRAIALEALDRNEEAQAAWKDFLSLNPSPEWAESAQLHVEP